MRQIFAILLSLGIAGAVRGQDPRGTILGRVTDSTGLAVPGVEVRATHAATGVGAVGRSNEAGNYSVPFLMHGTYTIQTAEIAGFKKYIRHGVEVRVSDQVELNISLELGQVSESVEVKAETPLLETATASLGQVMDQRRIQDLPLMGGNPAELMFLTPGVTASASLVAIKAAFSATAISANGSPAFTNEFQFDGVSNTHALQGKAYEAFRPPASAVSEFRVQVTPFDASVGHSMGAVVTTSSASGTNQLHGSADFFHANSAFSAMSFFQNKSNTRKPPSRDHRYEFSVGGPVRLPKLYNGSNRTFWFYAYHGNRWINPRTYSQSVPTEAWRRGDFSDLLAAGGVYQIYDPLTTVRDGNLFRRQPIPGNVIPASRLDQVGVNLANLYPLPNQAGNGVQRTSNYYITPNDQEKYYAQVIRLDHTFSDSHRMFLRLHSGHWDELKNLYFGTASGVNVLRDYRGLALDDVYSLSPTTVLNLRYGITSHDFYEHRSSQGYDLTRLGFSSNLTRLIDSSTATLPYVTSEFGTLGEFNSGDGASNALTHSLSGTLHKSQGSHQLKIGADYRVYRASEARYPYGTAPLLKLDSTYTKGPLNTSGGAFGQAFASMLLGVPAGSMTRYGTAALQDQYLGLYFHDDFKVTRRLTLNLGLRYEVEAPMTERYNRLVAGFAYGQSNPIEAAARANYAASANPVPELPLAQFRALGGLTYVNQGGVGRSPIRGEKNNVMPRFGFAFELTPKTVLRGGYGLYYDSLGVNALTAFQTGFSKTTPIEWSKDSGLTRTGATLANPFPNGLDEPAGAGLGLRTNLGQGISFYNPNLTYPYSQKWSFGVQRLLPGSFSLTASYVGSRATRVAVNRSLNDTPAQYLSTSPFRDQATINFLNASFPNPFYGLDPVYNVNATRGSMLRPYPHFGGFSVEEPIGYSWFHALQTLLEKRFSRGYTLQVNYTWSKLMDATAFLNNTDAALYEAVGTYDRRHRVAGTGIWEIPVGRGRHFGAGMPSILNAIAGGWQLGGLVSISSGAPLGFGNIIFTGNPDNLKLDVSERGVHRWFNVDAGFERNSSRQLASNIRTFPLRFSGLRADTVSRWDCSIGKTFRIIEKLSFQFRADLYNIWNHPSFAAPNLSPTSTGFGTITGLTNVPRQWQLGGKLKW